MAFHTAQTHAAKLKSNLEKLWWPSSSVRASSEPYADSYNGGNKRSTLSWFHLVLLPCSEYISLSDRIHLLLFPSSFSVVWQPPCPAWTPRRTRVERTVSFVHMSVSVSDMTEESPEVSSRSLSFLCCVIWTVPARGKYLVQHCDSQLLLFNPFVPLHLFHQWGHILFSSSLTVLLYNLTEMLTTSRLQAAWIHSRNIKWKKAARRPVKMLRRQLILNNVRALLGRRPIEFVSCCKKISDSSQVSCLRHCQSEPINACDYCRVSWMPVVNFPTKDKIQMLVGGFAL